MNIHIRMTGPSAEADLSSLYEWLGKEPDIRQHSQMSMLATEPVHGDMGTAFDVIQLVVDSGFQALNLALAYAAWRATRPSTPHGTIEHDGATATLNDSESDTVEAIVLILESDNGDQAAGH